MFKEGVMKTALIMPPVFPPNTWAVISKEYVFLQCSFAGFSDKSRPYYSDLNEGQCHSVMVVRDGVEETELIRAKSRFTPSAPLTHTSWCYCDI